MITLYTYKTFYASKGYEKLPLQCEFCGKIFHVRKNKIQSALKNKGRDKCCYCSIGCGRKAQTKMIPLECGKCGKKFFREERKIKKSKDGKQYCGRWCSNNRPIKIDNQSSSQNVE